MPVEAQLPTLQPGSLAIVANELRPELEQSWRANFLGDHRNRIELKVLVSGSRCSKQRGNDILNISFGKRGMQKQAAAIFYVAEVQTQWAAIGNNRSDWFILVLPVGQPDVTRPPEPYLEVQLVHLGQFWIRYQLLGSDVDTAARDRGDQAKGFFVGRIIRNNANPSPRGHSRILRQSEIHVPLNARERVADRLNHRSKHSGGKSVLCPRPILMRLIYTLRNAGRRSCQHHRSRCHRVVFGNQVLRRPAVMRRAPNCNRGKSRFLVTSRQDV